MRHLVNHSGAGDLASGTLGDAAGRGWFRNGLPGIGQDWPLGTHFVELPDIVAARRLLGPSQDSARRRRSSVFYPAVPDPARARLPLGMYDRGEEYVFGNGPLCDRDARGRAQHFPAHLKVIRLAEHLITAAQPWDVSASHTDWGGQDPTQVSYVLVKIDRLVVEPGSALEVHGNVLVLDCGTIERLDPAGRDLGGGFAIRIMPTRFGAHTIHRSGPGRPGAAGTDGVAGRASSASAIVSTPFGPQLLECGGCRNGEAGGDGTAGADGGRGQNGGMVMFADIRIRSLVGFAPASLLVSAQPGAGLAGGAGGDGGHGGAGGKGADGLDRVSRPVRAGRGGRGGNGGDGGNGGRGGNGGLASNIFVQVPQAQAGCVVLCAQGSAGGAGGIAGVGGRGGAGGADGAGPTDAHAARSGDNGRDGQPGNPGKPRPPPRMHLLIDPGLNEVPRPDRPGRNPSDTNQRKRETPP